MRLGGPSFYKGADPDEWVKTLRSLHYTAAYLEGGENAAGFAQAAQQAGIVIAEVGAWSNPLDADPAKTREAFDKCTKMLALADETGAVCCVNIAGSRGPVWDGPDPRNLLPETFDLIVESVRRVIDAVKPRRAFYTLETMPWIAPDSPDSYLALIKAIDRRQFAAHLDVVNMINCPARAFDTAGFIRECFAKLGPYIKGVHAKDIRFATDRHLTLHLDECAPGQGGLIDFDTQLREIARLHRDTPVMLEHMKAPQEYSAAAQYLRQVAERAGEGFL